MQNGIDVYTGQGVIDWRKVADSGISFAMIKASQGRGETRATKNLRSFTDSRFAYNIAEASKAGLMVGVWHWLTAQSVAEAIEEAEIQIKYHGYIERERHIADKMARLENIPIRPDFNYHQLNSLSIESRQKLTRIRPATIGQASRIPGVSPADINVLLVYFGR